MEEKFHPLKKKTCLEQSVHVRPRVIKVGPVMLAQALHEKCAWSLNNQNNKLNEVFYNTNNCLVLLNTVNNLSYGQREEIQKIL